MKQLIVNADDFGYTRGVNRAILDAWRSGIVTSASLMANGAQWEDAAERAKAEPGLDVGCHLNLVEGASLADPARIPHLAGADGKFHGAYGLALRLFCGAVPAVEMERECAAQVERLLAAGIEVSHLDTHKHTHLHPRVAAAVAATARRYGIGWVRRPFENFVPPEIQAPRWLRMAARGLNFLGSRFERRMAAEGIRLPDFFTGFTLTGRWTRVAMERTLAALPEGVTELMCHPGACDAELESSPTRLKREREVELGIVADAAWRERMRQLGIITRGFSGVPPASGLGARKPALEVAAPAGGN